ncbi:MAG: succinate dehydrogenase, cytochrome b subunit [Hyphomicrobiales bacterium]|nr:succinate dehydrogenase, cytochrome b subunit [Hyphomicrobiales bacterium]
MSALADRRETGYRRDALWIAALVHRLSGVALALFLPLHFLVLGLAIRSDASLDSFLGWARQPLVKCAEAGVVFCLAVHLAGGLRVLMLETRGWRPGQRNLAIAGVLVAALAGAAYLIGA